MHFLNYFFLPSLHSSDIRSYRISLQLDLYFINTFDTRDIKPSECYTRMQNMKMDPDRCNVSISASHDAILVFISNRKNGGIEKISLEIWKIRNEGGTFGFHGKDQTESVKSRDCCHRSRNVETCGSIRAE